MPARSVRRSVRVLAGLALAPALLVVATACASGDTAATPGPATATQDPAAPTGSAGSVGTGGGLPQACSLVPPGEINSASGLALAEPSPSGNERRSVCAFDTTASGGVGLSVGVEPASRFDAKAEASRNSVGVPGTEVPGLGERALFFYSDADLPEGVGGVLVSGGGSTIDITLQGVGDEARTRDAAVAIAKVALDRI
ncbi:hypothetical protein ACVGVM_07910 [Pseudonocardia bannensis]|uniref:DUF3558 domain-containing protein n=1 Tax=Pseudonocardia bannensis TaxID=630973 RepID=A0A848DCW2_9PSEU|nr:hypothetical protein [Pseudonocardia bannensis]NMH90441.1 hypothetical protein [Pseudonocardia bannensis]